jgi:hypothetical protein
LARSKWSILLRVVRLPLQMQGIHLVKNFSSLIVACIKFNLHHSSAHNVIEHIFGVLKNHFQILLSCHLHIAWTFKHEFLLHYVRFTILSRSMKLMMWWQLHTDTTHMMYSDASQVILTVLCPYMLKSWQFPLIFDDLVQWHWRYAHKVGDSTLKSWWLLLHSSSSKPRDLSLSPMQPSIPHSIPFDIPYSYPRSLFEIIPFPLPCSLPFHCKV